MQIAEANDTSILTAFFAHNTWANLKLLAFCAGLPAEQLDATAVGTYGPIFKTLVHIVGGEVSYVVRTNGHQPPVPFTRDSLPDFATLTTVARWTGDELLALARGTQAATLVREQEGNFACEYPLAELIVQAITHSTEHRTHICAILTALGHEPPDLSTWAYMVETGSFREWQVDADPATR